MSEQETNVGVSFKVDLAPSGAVNRVHITKDGQTISMTAPQASSLAVELMKRFAEKSASDLAGSLVRKILR